MILLESKLSDLNLHFLNWIGHPSCLIFLIVVCSAFCFPVQIKFLGLCHFLNFCRFDLLVVFQFNFPFILVSFLSCPCSFPNSCLKLVVVSFPPSFQLLLSFFHCCCFNVVVVFVVIAFQYVVVLIFMSFLRLLSFSDKISRFSNFVIFF